VDPEPVAHGVTSTDGSESLTLDEFAKEIISAAHSQGLTIRVIGGVAVRIRAPSATHRSLERAYGDIDMVGRLKESQKYGPLLEGMGFQPNRPFNTINGSSYLRFDHAAQAVHLDIFLDRLEMCHSLRLIDRLEVDDFTLALSDLLLTKLQIVHLTEKDIKDIVALVIDHDVEDASEDTDTVDARRIATICGADWGWYRTVTGNLEKCRTWIDRYLDSSYHDATNDRINRLLRSMEEAPKSMKWKLRARVGDKVKWYELPEDPTRD
jgi:hypothetical protein